MIRPDEHREFIELEDSNWIPIGVQNVVVANPVLAGTAQDHRLH